MKITRAFIKGTNWALAGLLSLLGFNTSCDVNGSTEYGTPYAEFEFKGKVTDASDNVVPNAKVVIQNLFPNSKLYYPMDSIQTDANGAYDETVRTYPTDQTFRIVTNKTDYVADTTVITVKESELTGGRKDWYNGKVTKTVNIKLKKK